MGKGKKERRKRKNEEREKQKITGKEHGRVEERGDVEGVDRRL